MILSQTKKLTRWEFSECPARLDIAKRVDDRNLWCTTNALLTLMRNNPPQLSYDGVNFPGRLKIL